VVALSAPAPTVDFSPNAGFGRLRYPADRGVFVGRKTEDVTKTGATRKGQARGPAPTGRDETMRAATEL